MSDDIGASVSAIFTTDSDHKNQSEKLKLLLGDLLTGLDNEDKLCKNVERMAEAVVNQDSVSMVVSRQFVSDIVTFMEELPLAVVKKMAIGILAIIQPRIISYEEQVAQVRFKLADIYEMEGETKEAVDVLKQIPLEAGQRTYPSELKMKTYLRIAQLALEYGDTADAETFVNRASMLQNDVKSDSLSVMYKAQYARVLDHRQRFIDAAQRYYELSLVHMLTNFEKKQALTNAATCTILASPCLQRSRMLTTLFKDERCETLPSHSVLRKMHLEQLIQKHEVAEFEKGLAPHQQEIHDGWSILQKSVVEHNIAAVSKVFRNISFTQLADLLDIAQDRTEKVVARMIAEQRINGKIDQLEAIIHFDVKDALSEWDELIEGVCQHVNNIADMISHRFPEWTEARAEA